MDPRGSFLILWTHFVVMATSNELTSNFHSLFVRMPELMLTGVPVRVLYNFSEVEGCASECARQTDFDCRSFDVDNRHRACKLYNTSHEDGKAYLQESIYTDHYRTAFEKLFNRLPNHVLTVKHKRKIPDVSVEQCARRCVFEQSFRCAGFDYEPGYSNCWLTHLTVTESDGAKFHPGADFYERDFGGALSNFISFGSGSLPYVDDRPIYTKTMFGLDLGACAQVCLSQTSFECASFDYSFGDRSCHMSRYVASNVGGIDNDNNMPTYRVMHYEKKGSSLERFQATPYSIVLGENDKNLERVTAERCAQACLEETSFVCRSFDYQIKDGSCMLSKKTASDVGKLYNQGLAQVHHFEMKPSLDCGGAFTDLTGDFASPGWPRNYTHHLNCTWIVQVPEHKVVMFTFIHFDLGKKAVNPCDNSNDRLRISEVTSQGEVTFCASPPMSTYISQTNSVAFNFVTNGRGDAQGFKVVFKGDWPCRATLTSDRGELASPMWPEQYSPGLNCAWTIKAPERAKVILKFTTIDLDSQAFGACTEEHDHIDVFDGEGGAASRLGRFCKHESPPAIISSSNVLLVTFRSDGFVQRTGFHASYDFILPTTAAPPTTFPTTSSYKIRKSKERMGERQDVLSAKFVEPRAEREGMRINFTFHEDIGFGIVGSDYIHPSSNSNSGRRTAPATTYITILWIVLVSLLLMTTVLSLVLLFVCRHNRSREEKKKALDKYSCNVEESVSLYKENYAGMLNKFTQERNFDDDTDSCRDYGPDADTTFANPLYRGNHTAPPRRSEITLVSVSDVLSDSGCSSSSGSSAGQDSTAQLIHSPC